MQEAELAAVEVSLEVALAMAAAAAVD